MTILSRCQRFDFRRIAVDEIIKTLSAIAKAEQITIDGESLMIIAKRADGSLRDSESIFDQVRAFCGNEIHASDLLKAFNVVDLDMFFRVTEFLKTKNAAAAITLVDEVMKNGYDLREFTGGLAEHFRNLLVVHATGSTQLVEGSGQTKQRYESEGKTFPEPIFCGISNKPTNLNNRSDGRRSRVTALKRRCFRWCPWKDRKTWESLSSGLKI